MANNRLPPGIELRNIDGDIAARSDQFMPNANIWEADGIPSDAFHVMTMVGSDNNPELLRSARFVDLWETAPIPQKMELLPDEERIPWTNDGKLSAYNGT